MKARLLWLVLVTASLMALAILGDPLLLNASLKQRPVQAVLCDVPEPVRTEYVRFILSVPSGWFNSPHEKARVLDALYEDHVHGTACIRFDSADLIPLLDAHNPDFDEPVGALAAYLIAFEGDPAIVEQAFERWSYDFLSVLHLRVKLEQASEAHPAAFARVRKVVARYDELLRRRYGEEYPF